MSDNKSTVYDPDPTDIQLQAWGSIGIEGLDASDLSKPENIKLLVHYWRITLHEIKAAKANIVKLQSENLILRDERENLRIKAAGELGKSKYSWLEIPVSIMSGFAINILSATPKNGTGWFLLIMSLLMLLLLRSDDIRNAFEKKH